MIGYPLWRSLLFCLDAETAHSVALQTLKYLPCWSLSLKHGVAPVTCMGLSFDHPVMLAAGFDKNADYVDALFRCGFSGIEVGTVTPKPQAGNPKPRCFRVPKAQALINRMGFNNKGVDYLVSRLQSQQRSGVIGVNIGKNKSTPNEQAIEDYVYCLKRVAPVADYVTINVSSPNTPGLRALQSVSLLDELLNELHQQRVSLAERYAKRLPLALKVTVDLPLAELHDVVGCAMDHHIDAVILSNTTIDHSSVSAYRHGQQVGGVSGAPLTQKSNECLAAISKQVNGEMDLIGVGGIMTASDAHERFSAGASLIQLYSGFIYHGPRLVRDVLSYTSVMRQ